MLKEEGRMFGWRREGCSAEGGGTDVCLEEQAGMFGWMIKEGCLAGKSDLAGEGKEVLLEEGGKKVLLEEELGAYKKQ